MNTSDSAHKFRTALRYCIVAESRQLPLLGIKIAEPILELACLFLCSSVEPKPADDAAAVEFLCWT